MTREHWLSAGILRAVGADEHPTISGLTWQKGAAGNLPWQALASNILCDRHNTALSPLDAVAIQLFTVVRHFLKDQEVADDPHGHEFALFHGDMFERWMLKLLWGGVAAQSIGEQGRALTGLRGSIDQAWLADVLFRGEPLAEGWGLYMSFRPGQPLSGQAPFSLLPRGVDGELWGAAIEFGAVVFNFGLGVPGHNVEDVEIRRHPQGLLLTRADTQLEKVVAIVWDDGGEQPLTYTRIADGHTGLHPSDL